MLNWDDFISDEMLAAYLDGNASIEEATLIEASRGSSELLDEVIDIHSDIENGFIDATEDDVNNVIDNPEDLNLINPESFPLVAAAADVEDIYVDGNDLERIDAEHESPDLDPFLDNGDATLPDNPEDHGPDDYDPMNDLDNDSF